MNTTSDVNTASPEKITMSFLGSKEAVAQFAKDLLLYSRYDFPSITITTRGASEDFSVLIVTDTSLVDTVKKMALNYSLRLTTT